MYETSLIIRCCFTLVFSILTIDSYSRSGVGNDQGYTYCMQTFKQHFHSTEQNVFTHLLFAEYYPVIHKTDTVSTHRKNTWFAIIC